MQIQLLADLSPDPGGEFGQILQSLSKSRQTAEPHPAYNMSWKMKEHQGEGHCRLDPVNCVKMPDAKE